MGYKNAAGVLRAGEVGVRYRISRLLLPLVMRGNALMKKLLSGGELF